MQILLALTFYGISSALMVLAYWFVVIRFGDPSDLDQDSFLVRWFAKPSRSFVPKTTNQPFVPVFSARAAELVGKGEPDTIYQAVKKLGITTKQSGWSEVTFNVGKEGIRRIVLDPERFSIATKKTEFVIFGETQKLLKEKATRKEVSQIRSQSQEGLKPPEWIN
jgi:hypothetical protein